MQKASLHSRGGDCGKIHSFYLPQPYSQLVNKKLITFLVMSGPFRIVEHVVLCQHLREYPAATADEQEQPLYLAVKQYIPLNNPNPQPGDVTILAAHANGFPKV